jgi:hypothetical protein
MQHCALERHTSAGSKQRSQQPGLEQLRSLNWERRRLQYSNIPSTAVVNFNNSDRETKVSGTIIATECNIYIVTQEQWQTNVSVVGPLLQLAMDEVILQ